MFDRATALYERAQNWAVGSDPGLLRLRMAARTTVSLAISLLILFLLTKATHQPLTVALLGVLITMVAGRAVNEPDPYQQKITIVLLPLILLSRIEETAIGAVIGVAVAILVLPTNARTSMRHDARAFLTTLAEVIETSVSTLFGHEATASPTDKARQLGRDLQQFRTTAKPLRAGVGGFSGRHSIDVLAAALHGHHDATVMPATDFLDAAETFAREHHEESERSTRARLLAIVHALRQIDRAVVSAAIDLGVEDVVTSTLKAARTSRAG